MLHWFLVQGWFKQDQEPIPSILDCMIIARDLPLVFLTSQLSDGLRKSAIVCAEACSHDHAGSDSYNHSGSDDQFGEKRDYNRAGSKDDVVFI